MYYEARRATVNYPNICTQVGGEANTWRAGLLVIPCSEMGE